jgi:5'-3' exonuclease
VLLILDGNNLAWAGYYGLERAMKPDTPERKHRVALLGLASMTLGVIARGGIAPPNTGAAPQERGRPRPRPAANQSSMFDDATTPATSAGPNITRVAIAFDEGRPLRRREVFPAYQTGREGDPKFVENEPTILAAIAEFCTVCETMLPFDVLREKNTEADDLIAGLVHHNPKLDKRIVSTDRDFLQLIGPKTTVYSPVKKVVIDENNFVAEAMPKTSSGDPVIFPRERFLDYRALTGDPSDNLPGVPGIGALTAAKLLAAHPLGDYLRPAAAPSVKRPGGLVREVLGRKSTAVEAAFAHGSSASTIARNRELMDLRRPAPCWDDLPSHTTSGRYNRNALESWLDEEKIQTVDRPQLFARLASVRP